MSELTVLQGVRLKGRVSEEGLAATLGEDPADIAETLAQLTAAGLLVEGKTLRISPEGRERLNALLAEERSGVDQSVLAKAYDEFRAVNNEFKALVSDWQIKDGQPNSHDDPEYDGAVLKRLAQVEVGPARPRHRRSQLGPNHPVRDRQHRPGDPAEHGLRAAHRGQHERYREKGADAADLDQIDRQRRPQVQGARERRRPGARGRASDWGHFLPPCRPLPSGQFQSGRFR